MPTKQKQNKPAGSIRRLSEFDDIKSAVIIINFLRSVVNYLKA